MPDFQIERGVPLQPRSYGGSRQGSRPKYPFADMEIGDSFFVGLDEVAEHKIRAAAAAFRKKHPEYKFAVYQVEEPLSAESGHETRKGVRVWRIDPD